MTREAAGQGADAPAAISAAARSEIMDRLERGRFDCAIIGGGISGAGIARVAARRGQSVALLEADERRNRVRKAVAMANSDAISELAELGALRGAIERALRTVPESSPAATRPPRPPWIIPSTTKGPFT